MCVPQGLSGTLSEGKKYLKFFSDIASLAHETDAEWRLFDVVAGPLICKHMILSERNLIP